SSGGSSWSSRKWRTWPRRPSTTRRCRTRHLSILRRSRRRSRKRSGPITGSDRPARHGRRPNPGGPPSHSLLGSLIRGPTMNGSKRVAVLAAGLCAAAVAGWGGASGQPKAAVPSADKPATGHAAPDEKNREADREAIRKAGEAFAAA